MKHIRYNCYRKYICPICEISIGSLKLFRAHEKKHAAHELSCKLCDSTHDTLLQLQSHMISQHYEKVNKRRSKYSCQNCDLKFVRKKPFLKHIAAHGNLEKPLKESLFRFKTCGFLPGPDGKFVHKCEYCSIYYATIKEKDEHKKRVHMKSSMRQGNAHGPRDRKRGCKWCGFRGIRMDRHVKRNACHGLYFSAVQ